MNRRSFLTGLGALVGGIALEQAIPLGRVWSFPKEIKCVNATGLRHLATVWYDRKALEVLQARFNFAKYATQLPLPAHHGKTIKLFRYA